MSKQRAKPRFRVYVQHPNGRKTRGRYYRRGTNAYERAKFLKSVLTSKFKVVVYHMEKRLAISEGRAFWPVCGMRMYAPLSYPKKG